MTDKEIPIAAYLDELAYLEKTTPPYPDAEKKSSVDAIQFSISYALVELIENTTEVSPQEVEKIRNLKQQLIDIITKAKDTDEVEKLALELLAKTFDLKIDELEDRIPYEKLHNRFINSLFETFKKSKQD